MSIDYSTVTELAGDQVTQEQVERLCHRYYWAGTYCNGKDVLEAACGTGQGLGYLDKMAKSIKAGDYDDNILQIARSHYGDRIPLRQFDAQDMPYGDTSLDVVILFEAIYYLPSAETFLSECRRVLRPGGQVLTASANPDLPDFNPSPYSHRQYGVVELADLFIKGGFAAECFGHMLVEELSLRQRLLRPVKKAAVDWGLMPRTMAGKRLLKRLVFGAMATMPAEIEANIVPYLDPEPLPIDQPDRQHKVIYCAARLRDQMGESAK